MAYDFPLQHKAGQNGSFIGPTLRAANMRSFTLKITLPRSQQISQQQAPQNKPMVADSQVGGPSKLRISSRLISPQELEKLQKLANQVGKPIGVAPLKKPVAASSAQAGGAIKSPLPKRYVSVTELLPDGSSQKKEFLPDGSVITTNTLKDGSTNTAVTPGDELPQ